uniref:Uncharacterized protein n=1 Tax=Arundo donax TaxID=35708 RepID=A0A0A8ZNW0_ARUDO
MHLSKIQNIFSSGYDQRRLFSKMKGTNTCIAYQQVDHMYTKFILSTAAPAGHKLYNPA